MILNSSRLNECAVHLIDTYLDQIGHISFLGLVGHFVLVRRAGRRSVCEHFLFHLEPDLLASFHEQIVLAVLCFVLPHPQLLFLITGMCKEFESLSTSSNGKQRRWRRSKSLTIFLAPASIPGESWYHQKIQAKREHLPDCNFAIFRRSLRRRTVEIRWIERTLWERGERLFENQIRSPGPNATWYLWHVPNHRPGK